MITVDAAIAAAVVNVLSSVNDAIERGAVDPALLVDGQGVEAARKEASKFRAVLRGGAEHIRRQLEGQAGEVVVRRGYREGDVRPDAS